MKLTKICSAALLAALLSPPPLLAKPMPSGRPTPAEMPMLPDYCRARFGSDENQRKSYEQKFGAKNFAHIHHHCIGLNLLNRVQLTFDKRLRAYYLQQAVSEFNYVLTRWPKDFVLTAEAASGKNRAETMQKTTPSGR